MASFLGPYKAWTSTVLFMTLIYNWIVTALIVGRLWWADRRLKANYTAGAPPKDYIKIIIALVESGALYSIALGAFLLAYLCGNVSLYNAALSDRCLLSSDQGPVSLVFAPSLPRIVGLVPTLICLVRIFFSRSSRF